MFGYEHDPFRFCSYCGGSLTRHGACDCEGRPEDDMDELSALERFAMAVHGIIHGQSSASAYQELLAVADALDALIAEGWQRPAAEPSQPIKDAGPAPWEDA